MVADVKSDERIVNEHQPLPQRRSDVIEEFERPRPDPGRGYKLILHLLSIGYN
jgi:hypothetical protein